MIPWAIAILALAAWILSAIRARQRLSRLTGMIRRQNEIIEGYSRALSELENWIASTGLAKLRD